MTYIPISPKERDAMLETIGVKSLDDLFDAIPAKHRFPKLDLPSALTEMEAYQQLSDVANANENVRGDLISFLGQVCTTTTSPPSWITCCDAENSTPPILLTSLKFHKARCRASSNTNR